MRSLTEFPENLQLAARAEVAACALDEGSALLDMRSNIYYTLNSVATLIWNSIQTPAPLGAICDAVEARFETTGRDVRADVQGLLLELMELGLVVAQESRER